MIVVNKLSTSYPQYIFTEQFPKNSSNYEVMGSSPLFRNSLVYTKTYGVIANSLKSYSLGASKLFAIASNSLKTEFLCKNSSQTIRNAIAKSFEAKFQLFANSSQSMGSTNGRTIRNSQQTSIVVAIAESYVIGVVRNKNQEKRR